MRGYQRRTRQGYEAISFCFCIHEQPQVGATRERPLFLSPSRDSEREVRDVNLKDVLSVKGTKDGSEGTRINLNS
jgi:hypothetical protein